MKMMQGKEKYDIFSELIKIEFNLPVNGGLRNVVNGSAK